MRLSLPVLSSILALGQTSPVSAAYKHVAVFSVDGLHSSDVDKYLKVRPKSSIAALLQTAYIYPNANTSAPSDSFPGSLAQFTGATPPVTGVWYDVTYDRAFYPPGTKCSGPAGTEVADDESLDYDSTKLFSGGINPAALPYQLVNGKCSPLYPHNRVRVNTAFEVIQAKGGVTAYTDKHPAYDIMRGPSGKGLTTGYFPEIASTDGTVNGTIAYDKLHVDAFLDWLDGTVPTHSEGTIKTIPTLFGGNFQSVSVAQKTVGYLNQTGQPFSPSLLQALDFVDASLGKVVSKLKAKGIYQDTLIIVASKHGQSPIDAKLKEDISPAVVTKAAGVQVLYQTSDDIALIFLNNTYDTQTAVRNLKKASRQDGLFEIFAETQNAQRLHSHGFGSPLADPAVPDIIVAPKHGIIYTGNAAKFAEHGGLSNDDRNVACFVSSPKLKKQTFKQRVSTTQVAPLILKALGHDPKELAGVKKEGTAVLPGF